MSNGKPMFTLSSDGIDLLKEFEGFKDTAYLDSAGIWTLGYGFIKWKKKPVTKGMTCTREEADDVLKEEVQSKAADLATLVTITLKQNQIDALLCFCYNVGSYAFATSTLRRVINDGKLVMEDHFTRWNKATDPVTKQKVVVNGLTKRRKREYDLFMKG